jgi:predicted RNA binding protein YcfA (HicA-like mRNA interferase family)
VFDDANEDEMHAHGIRPRQVIELLDNGPWIGPNKKRERASHMLIGRDNGGVCITVPIEPTRDPLIWRPVTAYPCSKPDELREARGSARR